VRQASDSTRLKVEVAQFLESVRAAWCMIRKSVQRFSENIMLK
jgi:hypothetical protein